MKTEYIIGGALVLVVLYFVLKQPAHQQTAPGSAGMQSGDQTGHDFANVFSSAANAVSSLASAFSHSGTRSSPQTPPDTIDKSAGNTDWLSGGTSQAEIDAQSPH